MSDAPDDRSNAGADGARSDGPNDQPKEGRGDGGRNGGRSGGRRSGKRGGRPSIPAEEVEANLALFASYVKDDEAKAKAARKAEQQARREAEAARRLVDEKDAAAARLKSLRSRSGVSAEERAEAEEAYRRALAAVVAAETGEAPTWAPEPEPEAEAPPKTEPEPEPESEGAVEAVRADGGDGADQEAEASSDEQPAVDAEQSD